jgi:hypothetical protein
MSRLAVPFPRALTSFKPLHAAGADPGPERSRLSGYLSGLEDAIHFAQAQFPAFAERNPWLALDSLQHQIWILLDPETESTR